MALSQSAQIVFAMLERAAELGDECPSNSLIATAIGASSISIGPRYLNILAEDGLITVERGAVSRVVTITATGKRTAGTVNGSHWRDRPENAFRKHLKLGENPRTVKTARVQKEVQPRVDRDPCPRCGTRRDIGCGHYPASGINLSGSLAFDGSAGT